MGGGNLMTAALTARPVRVERRAFLALALLVAMLAPAPASAVGSLHARGSAPLASVIVQELPGAQAAAEQLVRDVGGTVGASLGLVGGFEARVPQDSLVTLTSSPSVLAISDNRPLHLLSTNSTTGYDPTGDVGSMYNTSLLTGARQLWSQGYTGSGVGVALIDSGVAPVDGMTAPGKLTYGPDISTDAPASNLRNLDEYGHGTHMAGIIAGRDDGVTAAQYVSDTSDFLGMAPDANIVSVKVADALGNTSVAQVIAAIAWVIQHSHELNIQVLNLSFGASSNQPYTSDPLAFAVEQAWRSGITVVTAAGNNGSTSSGLNDPAYDPYVIAVGAADTEGTSATSDDQVAAFSSWGSASRTPDLVAPGVHMQSLRVPGSYIDQTYAATGAITPRFFRGSGTSQATAVVSGAAALLLSGPARYSPDQIKNMLTGSATPLAGQSPLAQGAGELNLAGALTVPPGTPQAYPPSGAGAPGGSLFALGSSWTNAFWKGSSWSSSSWSTASWPGSSWSGSSWSGSSWSGSSWSGSSWSGSSWSTNQWNGSSWSGSSWSSSSWSSSSWSSSSWSSSSWSSSSWSSSSWSDAQWA
jgi:serine protease AprX